MQAAAAANTAQPDTTPQFRLSNVIREVLETSYESDPAKLTEAVLRKLPREELNQALAQAMPEAIRQVNRQQARRVAVAMRSEMRISKRWEDASEQFRAGLVGYLTQRVSIGRGEWKLRGECTPEDLAEIAHWKSGQAAHLQWGAEEEAALGKFVEKGGYATVGDVPESELFGFLRRRVMRAESQGR